MSVKLASKSIVISEEVALCIVMISPAAKLPALMLMVVVAAPVSLKYLPEDPEAIVTDVAELVVTSSARTLPCASVTVLPT